MSQITLQLKAKYFKDVDYCSNDDCAVARAIKDQLMAKNIDVTPSYANIDGLFYMLDYGGCECDDDEHKAAKVGFDDSVIRKLVLTQ